MSTTILAALHTERRHHEKAIAAIDKALGVFGAATNGNGQSKPHWTQTPRGRKRMSEISTARHAATAPTTPTITKEA